MVVGVVDVVNSQMVVYFGLNFSRIMNGVAQI